MLESFKKFLKIDDNIDNGNVDTAFKIKDSVNADAAYRLTKYGAVKSDNTLLSEFFDRVNRMVSGRNAAGKFFGVLDIDIDILQFLPEIKAKLNELGYKVVVFDKDSVIKNGSDEFKIAGIETFIMILWDLESLKEIKAQNHRIENTQQTDIEQVEEKQEEKID